MYLFQRGSGRRDKLSIVADVLRVLKSHGPIRKTKLMNLVNLNTRSFEKYVDGIVVQLGLAQRVERGDYCEYAITVKGLRLESLLVIAMRVFGEKKPLEPCTACAARRAVIDFLKSEGYRAVPGGSLHGETSVVYHHDIVGECSNGGLFAVDVIDRDYADLVIALGEILVSCVDTLTLHVVLVPGTVDPKLAEKVEKVCRTMHIHEYTNYNAREAARKTIETLKQKANCLP